MGNVQSVLPAGRQITVPELTREERGRELERLAQAEISDRGAISRLVLSIALSALASDRLDGSALDDAWLEYVAGLCLLEDWWLGQAMWCDEGTIRASLNEALDALLDGEPRRSVVVLTGGSK